MPEAAQDPLVHLEQVLGQGTLVALVERQKYGRALEEVGASIKKELHRLEKLDVMIQALPLVVPDLNDQDHLVLSESRSVLDVTGRLIENAKTDTELMAIRSNIHQVGGLIERLSDRLKTAWRHQVKREFESFLRLASILGQFDITPELIKRIQDVAKRGFALADHLPGSDEQQEAFRQLKEERNQISLELVNSGMGDDVIEFLLTAVDRKATLADVPPEVWLWLKGRNALTRFQVHLG